MIRTNRCGPAEKTAANSPQTAIKVNGGVSDARPRRRKPNRSPGAPISIVLPAVIGVVLFFNILSCNQSEGTGLLTGNLVLPGCPDLSDPLEMSFDFFGMEKVDSQILEIRLQKGGRGLELSDGIVFQLLNLDEILNRRGRRIVFEPHSTEDGVVRKYAACDDIRDDDPDLDPCPLVRVLLSFSSSCDMAMTRPMLVGGSITFTHLGVEPGNRAVATFELYVIDGRTGEELGSELMGYFDFVVRPGQPFVRFVD